jgi:2Fe-2S ferredoxin
LTRIRFVQASGAEAEIDAADGTSVMRAAMDGGVPGVLAECGGSMTCATCHVYLDDDGIARAGSASEEEEAMLEMAVEPGPNSRLSCQIIVSSELEGLAVHVPERQY